jgi:hypothetical protein
MARVPGIMQLSSEQGDLSQNFYDILAQQRAEKEVGDIQSKEKSRSALMEVGGRAVSAGIKTGKDYHAYRQAKDTGKDVSNLPGVNEQGEFSIPKDFAYNMFKPWERYPNIRRALHGDPAMSGSPQVQQGMVSGIDHYTAPVAGSMINGMLRGQSVYAEGVE